MVIFQTNDKMKNRKNCVERLEAFFTNFFCNGT
ncbi:hypothetical protein CPC197_1064A, partial [Chlamydia psittaci C1/97]